MPEKVLISVLVNNESKFAKKIEKTKTLTEIRQLFGEKLPNDSIFTLPDGSEIEKEDEPDYILSEILKEDKVYVKSEQLSNKQNPSKNVEQKIIKKKNRLYEGCFFKGEVKMTLPGMLLP